MSKSHPETDCTGRGTGAGWYVVGHRDGGTSSVLAATGDREEADEMRALFEAHLEGYTSIVVEECRERP